MEITDKQQSAVEKQLDRLEAMGEKIMCAMEKMLDKVITIANEITDSEKLQKTSVLLCGKNGSITSGLSVILDFLVQIKNARETLLKFKQNAEGSGQISKEDMALFNHYMQRQKEAFNKPTVHIHNVKSS